VPTDKLCCLSF